VLGTSVDAAVKRDFVKKIAREELQFTADAKVLAVIQSQITKDIAMEIEEEFCFAAGMGKLASGERAGDGEELISDAFHGGNNDHDARIPSGGVNEAGGVEHSFSTEQRTAAKLESDEIAELQGYPAGVVPALVQRRGAAFV
jgi:hypothetical protein